MALGSKFTLLTITLTSRIGNERGSMQERSMFRYSCIVYIVPGLHCTDFISKATDTTENEF